MGTIPAPHPMVRVPGVAFQAILSHNRGKSRGLAGTGTNPGVQAVKGTFRLTGNFQ